MSEIILSGPQDGWEDIKEPLGERLVSRLKKFGKRTIQVYPDDDHESSAEWILMRAAAESCNLSSVSPGDVVAILCTNSPHYAPGALATLCAGATCATICYNMPPDDLSAIIDQLSPQTVMCTEDNAAFISQLFPSYPVVVLGRSPDTDLAQPVQVPLKNYKDQPAFYMFSSGSTGVPKRISLSHGNIDTALNMYRRSDSDVFASDVLVTTSPTFWYTGFIFQLISMDLGTCLVIPRSFNEISFSQAVSKYKATVVFSAPYYYVALSKSDHVNAGMFSSVRNAISTGVSLNAQTQKYIESSLGVKIFNWFGTTEIQVALRSSSLGEQVPLGSVGKIIPWAKAKVLDVESGATVGPGHRGELCISGPAVTCDVGPSGWFKTGDVAFYDEKGFFYVVDRIKETIKYRWAWMSPSELEAVILQHREVKEAVVVGVPHPTDNEHPAALVVRVPGATVTAQELCKFANEKIPDENKHLRGGVYFVDSYPKTASGKTRRLEARRQCIQLILDLQAGENGPEK